MTAPAVRRVTLPPFRLTVLTVRSPFFVTEDEVTAFLDWQRSCDYIRETDPNCGPEVGVFQRFCDGSPGDSWCDDFQSYAMHGVWPKIPLIQSGRCQTTRERAMALGWTVPKGEAPQRGDVGFCIDARPQTIKQYGRTHAHHIFAVQGNPRVNGVFDSSEGNTNPAGGSNGYGVFCRSSRNYKTVTGTSYYEFFRFPRQVTT